MAFLSDLLGKTFDASGIQGVQGTTNSTQGVQGTQGLQGTVGTAGTTLLTNTQSGTYTLQASDVGKVVSGITTVGIPSDVFNPGENIVILNNESDSSVIIDIAGASPVVSIYESGVVGVLTETMRVKKKSFTSVFCTRVNEFILSNIFSDFIDATGGTIIDSDGYRIHVFTGTGPFNVSYIPTNPLKSSIEYLVVAGGGAGAPEPGSIDGGGGGGAGGFRTGTGFPITVQDYTITVGGGGAPTSTNGGNSVFSTITSTGGGRGGSTGGSGGGGSYSVPGYITTGAAGNTPPVSPPQGNPGGNSSTYYGGGGGGAGASGTNASYPGGITGKGGDGLPVSWVPASYGTPEPSPGQWFAGGGGGGGYPPVFPGSTGGFGGGGPVNTNGSASPGSTNTGGGGGAASASGGSGIVIIRYPI